MSDSAEFVRPTQRCLSDLGLSTPDLGTLLHELEHPLVMRAQQVPERARAGGAERIRSLTDRIWFKVKTSSWRGATGELDHVAEGISQTWWIAAAGERQDDSAQHDFYARISAAAHLNGPKSCSTDFLLPNDWDRRRLIAEAAVLAERVLRMHVQIAAGESLLNGDIRGFDVGDRNVRIRVQMLDDGEVYLAVGATGSIDASFMTTLFSAIPGLTGGDWIPEPSDALSFESAPGEILWSALIGAETQQALLAQARRDW